MMRRRGVVRPLAVLAAAALFATAGCGGRSMRSSAARTAEVPRSIAGDCSRDVTGKLLAWFASVRDNTVLSFANGACYRIEGTLAVQGRTGLVFDGHGSTFRSSSPPSDHRAIWRLIESKHVVLRDMTIKGSYGDGGTFDAGLQHAHAVDVDGSSVDVDHVTMTDVAGDCVYFGRGPTKAISLSSGTVLDSTCLRTSRNAVAVVAGENILVQGVKTGSIGYNVFDVEPNVDSGWGSSGVTFDNNTIGSFAKNVYSIVEGAPVSNQSFTNNHIVGRGLKVAIADPAGASYRASDVTISGNTSDTPQTPAAINIDGVDGLTLTANTVPMTGGPMAAVSGSCRLHIDGNTYLGGSTEALIYPSVCSFTPARGGAGMPILVNGSGFNDASRVAVNGTPAPFALDSAAQLTVFVPRRAASGPIRVITPNGTATSSARFTVTGEPQRQVDSAGRRPSRPSSSSSP